MNVLTPAPRSNINILIAEDEADVRHILAKGLTALGYHVETAADGLDALQALAQQRFDLLLTDIVMPGMDGIALALKAAKEYPDMRVLLMTGYAAERQRAHNLDALIHDVLLKPFDLADVSRSVADVLAA